MLQVMGKNLIAKIPQRVAEYLELPNPKTYTGHAFRRTSATLLVDAGADMLTLKRHGVWKSNSTAEGYLAESINNKRQIGNLLSSAINLPSNSKKSKDESSSTRNIKSIL